MVVSSSPRRPRGASPGNQNARKHGFYAAQKPGLAASEIAPLVINFQAEIDLIRQSIQRVLAPGEPQTYREAVDYQHALSLAATALTRLVRRAASTVALLVRIRLDPLSGLPHKRLASVP
jgi:hypothetical protein